MDGLRMPLAVVMLGCWSLPQPRLAAETGLFEGSAAGFSRTAKLGPLSRVNATYWLLVTT